jgi:signal transduction histidine kinase
MQAMPEGGEIILSLRTETRGSVPCAVLNVADTGPGIPDAVRGRIFDSFLTGRSEGTGLGLAIAKRILQGHHGDIELVSTSPAGTTLQVTLPLARG